MTDYIAYYNTHIYIHIIININNTANSSQRYASSSKQTNKQFEWASDGLETVTHDNRMHDNRTLKLRFIITKTAAATIDAGYALCIAYAADGDLH